MHFPFQRTQTTPTCSKTSATALRTVEKSVLNQDSGRSLARLLAKTDAAVHLPSLRCSPNGQTALLSRHQRTGLCNSTLLARMQHAPPLLQKHSMHYILLAQHGSTCGKKNWQLHLQALGYDQVVDQTVFMPRSYTKQFGWSYQSYLWSLQHDSADTRLCFHDHSSPRREALPCERCVLPAVEGQSTWLPPRQCQHKLLRMPDTISHHSIKITNGQTFWKGVANQPPKSGSDMLLKYRPGP